jgi:hypothetical protein
MKQWKALAGMLSLSTSLAFSMVQSASAIGFTPPPDNRAPRQSTGGASRGDLCPQSFSSNTQPLPAAMTPASGYGKTLATHPTFLFYLPSSNTDGAFFTLKDEDKNLVYATEMVLDGEESIRLFQLPEDAPALEPNKPYQWFIVFKCDGRLYPDSYYVSGWVERTATSTDLAFATDALSKAAALGSAGIWYDSATTLASLQMAQPEDTELSAHWQELLTAVGLESLADVPLRPVD